MMPLSLENAAEAVAKKTRGLGRTFFKKLSFPSAEDALAFVKESNQWSIESVKKTAEGRNVFYHCKHSYPKTNGPQCHSAIYLLYHADSLMVSYFSTDKDHQHLIPRAHRGIGPEVREIISQVVADGTTKPKAILKAIENRGIDPPKKSQLLNHLHHHLRVTTSYDPQCSRTMRGFGDFKRQHSTTADIIDSPAAASPPQMSPITSESPPPAPQSAVTRWQPAEDSHNH
jgi:hypothetical protein